MGVREVGPTGEMYLVADELRSIAELGLHYADNDYDRERYRRARSLSARLVAAIEDRPADDVMEEYEAAAWSMRRRTSPPMRPCSEMGAYS